MNGYVSANSSLVSSVFFGTPQKASPIVVKNAELLGHWYCILLPRFHF